MTLCLEYYTINVLFRHLQLHVFSRPIIRDLITLYYYVLISAAYISTRAHGTHSWYKICNLIKQCLRTSFSMTNYAIFQDKRTEKVEIAESLNNQVPKNTDWCSENFQSTLGVEVLARFPRSLSKLTSPTLSSTNTIWTHNILPQKILCPITHQQPIHKLSILIPLASCHWLLKLHIPETIKKLKWNVDKYNAMYPLNPIQELSFSKHCIFYQI